MLSVLIVFLQNTNIKQNHIVVKTHLQLQRRDSIIFVLETQIEKLKVSIILFCLVLTEEHEHTTLLH